MSLQTDAIRFPLPYFDDWFSADDSARWIPFAGSAWPPTQPCAGRWAKMLQQGWPANTGSEDGSARFLSANGEQQSYEDTGIVTPYPAPLLLAATAAPGIHFPQQPYTSGCLTQNRAYALAGGYFNLRARLPQGQGLWPAFWMMPADGSWNWEIDIFEKPGVDQSGAPSDACYRLGCNNANDTWAQSAWVSGVDTAGLHDYGLLWDPSATTITYFRDGVAMASLPRPANATSPGYLIINLAVGGTWPGSPPPSFDGAVMSIRRVSSWKLGSWGASQIPAMPPL